MLRMNSGGLPITALFLLITIGLSISLGLLTIASIMVSSVNKFPLKLFFQIDSFFLTRSIGCIPKRSIIFFYCLMR